MAKKATKAAGVGKSVQKRKSSSSGASRSRSSSKSDPVDALIKLLQSPLVIDLLAVGATAALASITESRSNRAQGAVGNNNKKTVKAAGKAAAAAVGRRLAAELDEIREASKRAGDNRQAKGGAKA